MSNRRWRCFPGLYASTVLRREVASILDWIPNSKLSFLKGTSVGRNRSCRARASRRVATHTKRIGGPRSSFLLSGKLFSIHLVLAQHLLSFLSNSTTGSGQDPWQLEVQRKLSQERCRRFRNRALHSTCCSTIRSAAPKWGPKTGFFVAKFSERFPNFSKQVIEPRFQQDPCQG